MNIVSRKKLLDIKNLLRRLFVCIIPRLCVPKLMIFSVSVGQERIVTPALDEPALVEHGDFVAEPA